MSFDSKHAIDEKIHFRALEALAGSAGYAHVLAALCFNCTLNLETRWADTSGTRPPSSVEPVISGEIVMLNGLLAKHTPDLSIPSYDEFQSMVNKTKHLLTSLHRSIVSNIELSFKHHKGSIQPPTADDNLGRYLREAMLYGGEPAYFFQYRDFALKKYEKDNRWLVEHKGFTIGDVCRLYDAVEERFKNLLRSNAEIESVLENNFDSILSLFIISEDEVQELSGLSLSVMKSILYEFSVRDFNSQFKSPTDYNKIRSSPFISLKDSRYMLFGLSTLAQSIYETPFYWMIKDGEYKNTHAINRGIFAEQFCADRFRRVFGDDRVHANVKIRESRKSTAAEIDVLCHYGDRVLIVQVKSKRLTLKAMKGDSSSIKKDFENAVQNAYDQGLASARLLCDDDVRSSLTEKFDCELPEAVRELILVTVLSDNFPALSHQVSALLRKERDSTILGPCVLDLFALDVITEIVDNPLYFLSYLRRRCQYNDRISSSQELTIFGYHLSKNLWFASDISWIALDGGFSKDLDHVMYLRRRLNDPHAVPDGILTRLRGTRIAHILDQITVASSPVLLDLGLKFLELSEDTLREFDKCCRITSQRAVNDDKHHDFSMSFDNGTFGITMHVNSYPVELSKPILMNCCREKIYTMKSSLWYGLLLSPHQLKIRAHVRVEGSQS